MKLTVVGTGYVGLVTGACFAEMGNEVTCVDVDRNKVERLKQGILPIYEPGLDSIVSGNFKAGRLRFTTSLPEAMRDGNVFFIAVGTPPGEDGSADLQYVLAVAREIGRHLDEYAVIVDKSTVPVGTADKVRAAVQAELDRRGSAAKFDMVSNPEFLKEGAAVEDFMRPDRIVVGTDSERAREQHPAREPQRKEASRRGDEVREEADPHRQPAHQLELRQPLRPAVVEQLEVGRREVLRQPPFGLQSAISLASFSTWEEAMTACSRK